MTKKMYLGNAFSLQMIKTPANIQVTEVNELPNNLISVVGHADTAKILGVEMNRVSITLNTGDIIYVAQLIGGRLPEGVTELPEGFKFKYMKVEIY